MDLARQHVVQRQRRRPRLPEEARRRRLDGLRRRRSSRTPPTPTPRAAAIATWADNARARQDPRRREGRVRSVAQAAAVDGAAVRRRREEAVAPERSRLRMGQVREANTATRKNNGMMLAQPAARRVAHRLGARRDLRRSSRSRASGHFDEAKAALNFFLNAGPGRRATRAT